MDWTRTPNSNTYKFIFLPFPCTICSTHTPINTITTYQPQIGDQNDEFITKIASTSTTTPLNNQWTTTNTAKKPRKPQKKKNKRRKNYEHLDGVLEQEVVFGLPVRQRGEGPHGSARSSLEHRRTVWSRQGSRQRWKLYGPKKTPRSPRAIVPSLGEGRKRRRRRWCGSGGWVVAAAAVLGVGYDKRWRYEDLRFCPH